MTSLLPGIALPKTSGHIAIVEFDAATEYEFTANGVSKKGTTLNESELVAAVRKAQVGMFFIGLVAGALLWFSLGRMSGRKAARRELRTMIKEVRDEKTA